MIFRSRAPLKEQLTLSIEHKYRKCPMKFPLPVRVHFLRDTNLVIRGIDQDDVFFHALVSPVPPQEWTAESREMRAYRYAPNRRFRCW